MNGLRIHSLEVQLGNRLALSDIKAEFLPGRLHTILGPNGAGKSTLLRALVGIEPAIRSEIFLDGQPLSALSRRQRAQSMAYLPQSQLVHWGMTARRIVALGRLPYTHGHTRLSAGDEDAITRAMTDTDTLGFANRPADQLSGGERARVLLARALAVDAPILLADEPLAALDPGHQIDVMRLLLEQARRGKTVITVLHDLTLASRYCDTVLVLDDGRVAGAGAPEAVLTSELLARVYGITALRQMEDGRTILYPNGRAG